MDRSISSTGVCPPASRSMRNGPPSVAQSCSAELGWALPKVQPLIKVTTLLALTPRSAVEIEHSIAASPVSPGEPSSCCAAGSALVNARVSLAGAPATGPPQEAAESLQVKYGLVMVENGLPVSSMQMAALVLPSVSVSMSQQASAVLAPLKPTTSKTKRR